MLSQQKIASPTNAEPEKNISFIEFHSKVLTFIEPDDKKTLTTKDKFKRFIAKGFLFDNQHNLTLDWPHNNETIPILIHARIYRTYRSGVSYELTFMHHDAEILSIICTDNDELRIWHDERNKTIATIELIDLFKQIFKPLTIIYTLSEEEPPLKIQFSKAEFTNIMTQYQTTNLTYRINKAIIENASAQQNNYFFYLQWPLDNNNSCLLKINLSRRELFKEPTDSAPGYSWILNESTLLTLFPEYAKYHMRPGQLYYKITISEILNNDTNGTSKEVIDFWMTLDGKYGELHNVHRGKNISGNTALAIYNYFDQFFKIKTTFLCDAASLPGEIPLCLITAIVNGKTWYEAKIPGLKLFNCEKFKSVSGEVITQNENKRLKLLSELQNLKLKDWHIMLNEEEGKDLFNLYINYFPKPTSPKKLFFFQNNDANPFTHVTHTLQDLAAAIYKNTRKANDVSDDLILLSQLLYSDHDDEIRYDDWVQDRVNELVENSFYWIKERQENTISEHQPTMKV